jgi:hypothetical protein
MRVRGLLLLAGVASSTLRLRDPGLIYVTTNRLMDHLRKEPRFQAIERTLKFPP